MPPTRVTTTRPRLRWLIRRAPPTAVSRSRSTAAWAAAAIRQLVEQAAAAQPAVPAAAQAPARPTPAVPVAVQVAPRPQAPAVPEPRRARAALVAVTVRTSTPDAVVQRRVTTRPLMPATVAGAGAAGPAGAPGGGGTGKTCSVAALPGRAPPR